MSLAAAGRIELWCTFLGDVDPARLASYRAWLCEAERARLARFHFEADRLRHLVARALVRSVLSRYGPRAPQEWRFSADANGRPRIANPPPGLALDFNLSHAGELAVLAVAAGRTVGVDVESLARTRDTGRLERYFAPAERAALAALPAAGRRQRFFELWTLKESYLKARGVGLRLPLDAFAFEFPGERGLRLSFAPPIEDLPRRWRLRQFTPRPDYLVSVCGERNERPCPITVYEAVPLAWERLAEVDFSRSSDEGPPPAHGP